MFVAALFTLLTIAKVWNYTKCPSTDEWIIYIIKWTTQTKKKKNKISPFATTRMDLEGMLSEISQTKTNTE